MLNNSKLEQKNIILVSKNVNRYISKTKFIGNKLKISTRSKSK